MSEPKKLGLVGCGNIGRAVARAAAENRFDATLTAVCDADRSCAEALVASLPDPRPEILDIEELARRVDIVVECAAPPVAGRLAELCPKLGADLLALSVGGIRPEHFAAFREAGQSLYIPSGAVCGLDGIQAAALGDIESVRLTTRKPPRALKGAPGVDDAVLDGLAAEMVIFEGGADEAVALFPKNVNVAATVALAVGAPDKFRVTLIADPNVDTNVHEIALVGSLGTIRTRVENQPSPDNPKTSALAVYSAIATLKKICSSVKIGT